jgi:DNA-binding MarR family transcriptional regulator
VETATALIHHAFSAYANSRVQATGSTGMRLAAARQRAGMIIVILQNKPLTDTQKGVLKIAGHYKRISQSRLAVHPATLDILVQRGYLETVQVPYSEPYYRLTDAGRAVLEV